MQQIQNNYDHIPYKDSEDGAKLRSGKCSLKSLTCVIGSGGLFSQILILTVPPDTGKLLILFKEWRHLAFDHNTR